MHRTVAVLLLAASGVISGVIHGQEQIIVPRSSIRIDTVRRGDIVRSVRGLGVLTAVRTAELKIPELQAREIEAGQKVAIDTRNGGVAGLVTRKDGAAVGGDVTVHVQLQGDLPRGVVPGLNVDGAIHLLTLNDVVYVGRPGDGRSEQPGTIFRLEPDGQSAVRQQVEFGLTALSTAKAPERSPSDDRVIEIRSGLQPGDRVILSDMTAFKGTNRVRLQ